MPADLLPTKTLAILEHDVPHVPFDAYKAANPAFAEEVEPAAGEDQPAPFLTIDEIEDYLYEVDQRLGLPKLPTLAPLARKEADETALSSALPANSTRDFMLKHPHSAYNWLKHNAAHVFLQGDGEDEETGKKGRGGPKGEKGSKGAGRGGNKRTSSAKDRLVATAALDGDMSVDDDVEYPVAPARKRKRADDDGGYRPKGGSSRPSKKKRKSDTDAVPTSSKKRRVSAAARDE